MKRMQRTAKAVSRRSSRAARAMLIGMLAMASLGSQTALAAAGDTGPVYLQSVGVLAVADGGHLAGNMEIEVRGGFTLPPGVVCDTRYITTLQATDADLRMFTLLTAAHLKGKSVRLRITDDPARRAFIGRCSLMWVGVDP
ncbi:hypothetical protein CDN99_20035 [Roseateles aquatilis]|uniref:H-type lectin domain-containing protein n=1 Tax=Roseateles aquatilis TaxID=431061 RepID=A0A246J320_9BURK|nr:hypothetical protein [Roseateles aquatilis]OWQ86988.1 hypothetical protein CDN99_20035 [Roseateles aquatilis]